MKKSLSPEELNNYDSPALTSIIYYWNDYDKDTVVLAYILLQQRNYKLTDRNDIKRLFQFIEKQEKSIEELIKEYNNENNISNSDYQIDNIITENKSTYESNTENKSTFTTVLLSFIVILFLCVGIYFLVNSNNSTPKCDQDDVLLKIKEMTTKEINNHVRKDIVNKVVGRMMGVSEEEIDSLRQSNWSEKRDQYLTTFNKYSDYIELYFKNNNDDSIPNDLLKVIKDVVTENNYSFTKLTYLSPEVSNIRLIYVDDETKTCGCNANISYEGFTHFNKSITYILQRNTDGEVYIQLAK